MTRIVILGQPGKFFCGPRQASGRADECIPKNENRATINRISAMKFSNETVLAAIAGITHQRPQLPGEAP
jgi:hypothetical protein